MSVYIIGHVNPDTDSICAAIALAHLKQQEGMDAVAARAGKPNRETQFVLDYFGLEAPLYLSDLYLKVRDFYTKEIPTTGPNTSLYEAWHLMKEREQKTLVVVDEQQKMLGMLSVGDLSKAYMGSMGDLDMAELHIPLANLVKVLDGTVINGNEQDILRGQVYVGAMHPDTLETMVQPGSILLIGNRPLSQERAIDLGVSALILTGGAELSESLIPKVRAQGIIVISTRCDTYTTARLLPLSAPVKSIMKRDQIISFQEDDLISEVRPKMVETRYRNYPVLDEQDRVVGLISRYHLLKMNRKQVILVDHNEYGQAVAGVNEAQILEIIDHHRVGGIQTGEPIVFRNEPVGSTCTLVASCYRERGVTPPPHIAGILLAGILSDTVIFKSPTCTPKDKTMVRYLEEIAGIDAQEFGVQMFKAGSNLQERSVQEMIEGDLKEFTIGSLKLGIGQISVMGLGGLEEMRAEIIDTLEQERQKKNLPYLMLMVTDLIEENTELFVSGENPEKIAEVFGRPFERGSIFLPGVLSRKKQIVPPLSNGLN